MNKDLKDKIFDLPQDVLNKINHTIIGLNGETAHGIERAKKLLSDKKVKYGQLKRIIHDLQNIDPVQDRVKYDLCGGDLMNNWAKQHLDLHRDFLKTKKEGRKNADEMSGITGERKNSFLKKHTKKQSFLPPLNMMKSNSHKNSIGSLKLTEEINKIKKLIIY
jgi:hypothetical protein